MRVDSTSEFTIIDFMKRRGVKMKCRISCVPYACLLLLLFLVGCSGEARVRFAVPYHPLAEDPPSVMVTFRDGDGIRWVELDSSNPSAGPFSTKTSGDLEVKISILSAGSGTIKAGSITLPLKDDWGWGVDFYISGDDPGNDCFGCFGSESFTLDPALGYEEDKKLFIVWGGNSISNPAVY